MKPARFVPVLVALALVAPTPARADVVINEIMYHAPDDLDDLQFIEFHNTGDKAADLGGWKLKGVKYEFPAGTKIEAGGYLVVCKNLKEFKKQYGFDAAGEFTGKIGHNGETLDLIDAAGKKMDTAKFKSRAPWPAAPDGESSSLERICPTSPGIAPENWAPSPLLPGAPKPGGTPGKKNSVYSATLPPVIANVTVTPGHATPQQEIKVTAEVKSAAELKVVELRYRVAGSDSEAAEVAVAMTKGDGGVYSATIPAQKAGQIVRFRIRATDAKDGERTYPHPNDVRPALSVYVHDKFELGKIPLGFVISVGQKEFRDGPGRGGHRVRRAGPSPTRRPAATRRSSSSIRRRASRKCSTSSASCPAPAAGRSTSTRTARSAP